MSGTSQLEAQIAEIEDGIKALRTQIPVDQERIDMWTRKLVELRTEAARQNNS